MGVTPEILEEMINLRNNHFSIKDIAIKYRLNPSTVSIKLKGKCKKNRIVAASNNLGKTIIKIPDDFTKAPDDMIFDFRKFHGI